MKYLYTIIAFSALPFLLPAQDVISGSINYEGVERDYRLYVPSASNSGEALPLVFNLHGYGSNATQQEFYSGMNMVADTAGFFICYPNGRGNAWNVGWDFGSTADDVGFISALIDELAANYDIDPQRVYSCGMSNGGFMSYRLACELNSRIAAIASVTGSMVPSYLDNCNPGREVPVMEIHGTIDDIVPYEGDPGISVHIDTVVQFWAENNSCNLNPVAENLPDASLLDGSTVTRFDYNDCEDSHQVSLLRVIGGGHTWPGSILNIGATNQDINASVEIWRFFSQFTLGEISSLEEVAESKPLLQLFPNPTAGMIQLNPRKTPVQAIIYNAMGQAILSRQIPGSDILDISSWPAGIYFLEAIAEQERAVTRFVKR